MNAVAVRTVGNRYERTTDLKRMLTSSELVEAFIKAVRAELTGNKPETNILAVLPARAATSMRYDKGAESAVVWNEGGKEEKITLPLEGGWRKSDGNSFGVPNGAPSSIEDPEALYLCRHQDGAFSGAVGFGIGYFGCRGRCFNADNTASDYLGVALVGQKTTGPIAQVDITNPEALLERAALLESAATELTTRLKLEIGPGTYNRLISPIVEEAAFLRGLAGKTAAA